MVSLSNPSFTSSSGRCPGSICVYLPGISSPHSGAFFFSTLVLDEVLFKMILMEASNKLNVSMKNAVEIAQTCKLLPHDATHAAVAKEMNIRNIATNDEDFERVDFLRIWNP